jgi:hypothetical protein
MRNAWDKPEYIVNLVKNVVGREFLSRLNGEWGENLPTMLWRPIEVHVSKMTDETLGRICGYGTSEGIHTTGPLSDVAAGTFLNRTGFKHFERMNTCFHIHLSSGRATLERLAITTIICIARDIVMQEGWQADRQAEVDMEHDLERADHEMLHGRTTNP